MTELELVRQNRETPRSALNNALALCDVLRRDLIQWTGVTDTQAAALAFYLNAIEARIEEAKRLMVEQKALNQIEAR